VCNQRAGQTKRCVTIAAFERSVDRVSAFMPHKMAAVAEGSAAYVAVVWGLAAVNKSVCVQRAALTKRLVTFRAREGRFPGVYTFVDDQTAVATERFMTRFTFVRLLGRFGAIRLAGDRAAAVGVTFGVAHLPNSFHFVRRRQRAGADDVAASRK